MDASTPLPMVPPATAARTGWRSWRRAGTARSWPRPAPGRSTTPATRSWTGRGGGPAPAGSPSNLTIPRPTGQGQVADEGRGGQPGQYRPPAPTPPTPAREAGQGTAAPASVAEQRQSGDQHPHCGECRHPGRLVVGSLGPGAPGLVADSYRRGARPVFALPPPGPNTAEPGAISAPAPTSAPAHEGAPGTDPGTRANPDFADDQLAAVEPVAAEIDLRLDRTARPEAQQPGHRRSAVQVDVGPHRGAQQPGVPTHQHRPRDRLDAHLVGQPIGQPQAQVHLAAARVAARADTGQNHPDAHGGDQHPSRREQNNAAPSGHPPPGERRQPGHPRRVGQIRRRGRPDRPAQPGHRAQRQQRGSCPRWVFGGTGWTLPLSGEVGVAISSRWSARPARVGWS